MIIAVTGACFYVQVYESETEITIIIDINLKMIIQYFGLVWWYAIDATDLEYYNIFFLFFLIRGISEMPCCG